MEKSADLPAHGIAPFSDGTGRNVSIFEAAGLYGLHRVGCDPSGAGGPAGVVLVVRTPEHPECAACKALVRAPELACGCCGAGPKGHVLLHLDHVKTLCSECFFFGALYGRKCPGGPPTKGADAGAGWADGPDLPEGGA